MSLQLLWIMNICDWGWLKTILYFRHFLSKISIFSENEISFGWVKDHRSKSQSCSQNGLNQAPLVHKYSQYGEKFKTNKWGKTVFLYLRPVIEAVSLRRGAQTFIFLKAGQKGRGHECVWLRPFNQLQSCCAAFLHVWTEKHSISTPSSSSGSAGASLGVR